MKRNEGLKSRIPYWIDFPDYTAEELTDIFKLMIHKKGFCVTDDAIKEAHYIFEKVRNIDDFGNGRYVRNLMERAMRECALTAIKLPDLMWHKGEIYMSCNAMTEHYEEIKC